MQDVALQRFADQNVMSLETKYTDVATLRCLNGVSTSTVIIVCPRQHNVAKPGCTTLWRDMLSSAQQTLACQAVASYIQLQEGLRGSKHVCKDITHSTAYCFDTWKYLHLDFHKRVCNNAILGEDTVISTADIVSTSRSLHLDLQEETSASIQFGTKI